MSSVNSESCTAFFWSGFCLFLFSLLISVAKTSKIMLNSSSESGDLSLVSEFRENTFKFSPSRVKFAVGLSYMAFIILSYVPSMHCFWKVFIISGCWILSNAFSAYIEIIIWFLSFNLLTWCITLIDLCILKNPCVPGVKPTWSWCMIFFICCWILFPRIFLKDFCIYVHQSYWSVVFFFCGIFVWFWY